MTTANKPLPDVEDRLLVPFWAATCESRLVVQTCARCGYRRWPPGPICPECQSPDHEWSQVSGRGRLLSYAVYHRALDPAFAEDVPYTVGLVELAEGPRMYGMMTGPRESFVVDMPVMAVFEPMTPEVVFVRWAIADEH